MDYLQNHCFCRESNWDGAFFYCRHLVSMDSYGHDKDDWIQIVDEEAETFLDERLKKICEEINEERGRETKEREYRRSAPKLKPHVLKWLEDNVADRKGEECNKGWCIGSAQYRATDDLSMTVFFHRKRDAMAFIKAFSKYKKPVSYCQYFTDDRKKLNLETGKYEAVE